MSNNRIIEPPATPENPPPPEGWVDLVGQEATRLQQTRGSFIA
jgi:hypothetical protein